VTDPPTQTKAPASGSLFQLVRESLAGVEYDYTKVPIKRAILLLAIPMVLEMVMESLFAICDVFFVARLGPAAVATVGLTESLLMLFYALAFGLSVATTAMVSRRIGEKNRTGAVVAAAQAILIALFVALGLGVPAAFFAPELLNLMGAEQEVIRGGSVFATISLASSVVVLQLFLMSAIFRGSGDPAISMRALWLANGANIVLDPCFIFGLGPFPEMGVTGAAVATTIGRTLGVIYLVWALFGRRGRLKLRLEDLRIVREVLKRLIRVSGGAIAQNLVETASWILLVRVIASFGSVAVAGYTVAMRVTMFALLPSWGLASAAATLVGQNLGAKRPARARHAVRICGVANTAFLLVLAAILIILDEQVVGVFANEPEVIQIGADCLRIVAYGYPFYAWEMVLIQAFNGAGDTMTPTWINLGCFWFFKIPTAWLLSHYTPLGVNGVFIAVALAYSVSTVVALLVFRRGRWATRVV